MVSHIATEYHNLPAPPDNLLALVTNESIVHFGTVLKMWNENLI